MAGIRLTLGAMIGREEESMERPIVVIAVVGGGLDLSC